MEGAPAEIEAWRRSGRDVDVFGRRVFARVEGEGKRTPVVFLHGFPTSSFDLRHALPFFSASRRAVVHDHLGFGLSEKPRDYSYSLFEQADAAVAVWKALGISKAHLVAHDYGTSVAAELCARAVRGLLPFEIASATFCNGSMIFELAKLRVTQQLLRSKAIGPTFAKLASYRVFRLQMKRIFGDPDSVPDRELELAFWLIAHDDGRARMAPISSYHDERIRFRTRWIDSLAHLKAPVHLLWGDKDPIAVPAIPKRVAEISRGKLEWLEGLGHYPMLEDPGRWAKAALQFIDSAEAR